MLRNGARAAQLARGPPPSRRCALDPGPDPDPLIVLLMQFSGMPHGEWLGVDVQAHMLPTC